MLTVAKYK